MVLHLHVTYNDIHSLIRASMPRIGQEFNPDILLAIGTSLLISDCPYTQNIGFSQQAEGTWLILSPLSSIAKTIIL